MSQPQGANQRQFRDYNRNEVTINMPPNLVDALDLNEGDRVAIHDDGESDSITVYRDVDDAPTYAYRRRVRWNDEYLLNMPDPIVDDRGLSDDYLGNWGEPDSGVVELTPTEAAE